MNDVPAISAQRTSAGQLELDFSLAHDCAWLEGHFPGFAILPGVVQVGWAAHFAARWLGKAEPPMQLRRVKFKRPILPGARLTLRLAAEGCRVAWEYLLHEDDATVTASSGRLDFEVSA